MTPEQFRKARRSLGLNQTQMAKMLGFTRQASVSDIENKRKPLMDGTRRLMEAYLRGDRPPDWPTGADDP